MKKTLFRVSFVIVMIGLVLKLLPSFSNRNEMQAPKNNEIVIPVKSLPVTSDPHKMLDIYSMFLSIQIHRGLTRYNSSLEIDFDLASKIVPSRDGMEYSITLKEAYFSDGVRITASDVVRTFKRLFVSRAGIAPDLTYIRGSKLLMSRGRSPSFGVAAVKPDEVRFRLSKPSGLFIKHLSLPDCGILKLNESLEFIEWNNAGSGAYSVGERSDSQLVLNRSNFNQDERAPKVVRLLRMSEAEVFERARKSEINSVDGFWIAEHEIETLKSNGWNESVSAISKMLFLSINPKVFPVDQRRFLQRLVSSFDFSQLSPNFKRLFGLIPDIIPGALPEMVFPPKGGRKPNKFSITLLEDRMSKKLSEVLSAGFESNGILVNVKQLKMEKYLSSFNKTDFDLILVSKFLDYPDGMSMLTYFASDSPFKGFFPEKMDVDTLLRAAQNQPDAIRRIAGYQKIQRQILNQSIIVPLVTGNDNATLWGPGVEWVPPHPMGIHTLVLSDIKIK